MNYKNVLLNLKYEINQRKCKKAGINFKFLI